jgi:hypothetical protein
MSAQETDPHAPEGVAANPPKRGPLLLMTAGACLVGAVIVLGAVLPAEFNKDPLGLGKATGLSRLWAPPEETVAPAADAQPLAREYPAAWRSDEFEIPLTSADDYEERRNELEFKVHMNKGATYVYSWSVDGIGNPEEFYYDFHGQTLPDAPGGKITVAEYKQATGTGGNGALVAPFDGVHGWYLQNQSAKPVKVRLRLAGFYELVPAGQEGNLTGIEPLKQP